MQNGLHFSNKPSISRRAFMGLAGVAGLAAAGLGVSVKGAANAVGGEAAATTADAALHIEAALDLRNMGAQWSYGNGAWTLSPVAAVTAPELPDQQGVSVCVPAAYVVGIDTDGDGVADVTADSYKQAVCGNLVIDRDATVISSNGQVYTASTAPLILNTGAAGYGSSNNSTASPSYAAEGYVNISCGNRGKQDQATDASGNAYYTGDAPCCLADQKCAARFVKYNVLLGNLPGDVDRMVSTGGSGGGAHAAMFAATSNNPDFYDYQIEAGAVGVYRNEDGGYTSAVTIDGTQVPLSDGAWGCVAYSAITSLSEADMALAFEYTLDPTYGFNTGFQKALASHLSQEYMGYINDQGLSIDEAALGLDVDGDGSTGSQVALSIEYDPEAYPETNGYHGTYLDLYLAKFQQNLQWYLDNLDYAQGWTWFDENGEPYGDEAVAAMTLDDRKAAFIEGRYAKASSGGMGCPGGGAPGGMGEPPSGGAPSGMGEPPSGMGGPGDLAEQAEGDGDLADEIQANTANQLEVGTPDAGTTQASGSGRDSGNYADYAEMLAAYRYDVDEVYAGDKYGKNPVELYNPLAYIGAQGTEAPAWTRILMGASEGDMSMFASMNMQIKWLANGTDSVVQWQWDGGHVPSEVLGDSFALHVDEMFGAHVEGALTVEKPAAVPATTNGDAEAPTGTDLTGWVDCSDLSHVGFTLGSAAAYRTAGAAKACPAFDVIDYGQEDYVFGDATRDARHWNKTLVEIFEDNADELEPLFNNK